MILLCFRSEKYSCKKNSNQNEIFNCKNFLCKKSSPISKMSVRIMTVTTHDFWHENLPILTGLDACICVMVCFSWKTNDLFSFITVAAISNWLSVGKFGKKTLYFWNPILVRSDLYVCRMRSMLALLNIAFALTNQTRFSSQPKS